MSAKVGILVPVIIGTIILIIAVFLVVIACTNPQMLITTREWSIDEDTEKDAGSEEAPPAEEEAPADVVDENAEEGEAEDEEVLDEIAPA